MFVLGCAGSREASCLRLVSRTPKLDAGVYLFFLIEEGSVTSNG